MENIPRVICIGGPPGAGKTTAGRLVQAQLPGSILIDPDETRLAILGRPPGSAVTAADLTPELTARTIMAMTEKAQTALALGQSVIVPSAFIGEPMRTAFEALAARFSCEFHGFWLDAPGSVIAQRQQDRAAESFNNASKVVTNNPAHTVLQGALSPRWRVLDASRPAAAIAADILAALGPAKTTERKFDR